MARQKLEEIIEKKVGVLKKEAATKQKELQEILVSLAKHERALESLRGNFAEKRGRAKKNQPEQTEESQ